MESSVEFEVVGVLFMSEVHKLVHVLYVIMTVSDSRARSLRCTCRRISRTLHLHTEMC